MLNTCMPHQVFYKLQERLVQKKDNKPTILIVDDDIDTLTVTGRSLQHAGFEVHAFADPHLRHYNMFRRIANTVKSSYLISGCLH
jgi:PleD family two-component response regulator